MRFPIVILSFLLAICLVSVDTKAAMLEPATELTTALSASSVSERDKAITLLRDNTSPQATALLTALRDGRLMLDRESGTLYIADTGDTLTNALTGELISKNQDTPLRKVGTSNRQRQEISAILDSRMLTSSDVQARRIAAAALTTTLTPAIDRETLTTLLTTEKDGQTRDSLNTAWALLTSAETQSSTEDLLRAITALEKNAQGPARQTLEKLARADNATVATTASEALYRLRVKTEWAGFAETLFFGLSLGSIMVLAAIGLTITFGVMGVINMAHGEMMMLGAYTAWGLQQILPGHTGLALLLAIPASFMVSGGMGILLERTVIRFLYGRPLETLLATFGISLILQQAVRTLISPMNRAVASPEFMSGMWQISSNFSLTCNRVYIIIFCMITFGLIYAAMHKTRLGLEVRAVSQNRSMARAMGIRDARVDALTFGLGSGIAGMAGVALSQITNVGPNLGQTYIIDSFMVVVFGGVGNLWGTLVGGLTLGVANKILEPISGAMLSRIIILVGIILFIQKRPRGLFPQKGRAAEG